MILRYILNENIKYDCNKSMIALNKLSISKNQENANKTTYIQKNLKSISGKIILLSLTVIKENNKKINIKRNKKIKAFFIQNNLDAKNKIILTIH